MKTVDTAKLAGCADYSGVLTAMPNGSMDDEWPNRMIVDCKLGRRCIDNQLITNSEKEIKRQSHDLLLQPSQFSARPIRQ